MLITELQNAADTVTKLAEKLDKIEHDDAVAGPIGSLLAAVFGMRRDPQNPERWRVQGGNKTDAGVARTALRILLQEWVE